jgi:hypothetical protein
MHECQVEGCAVMLPRHLLMCRRHWYRVPAELRGRVNQAWRAYEAGRDVKTYLAVRQEAIEP